MHFTSLLLVFLHPGLSSAAPRIPPRLSASSTFTPPSIISTSFSGNGCPQGTTDASVDLWEKPSFKLPSFKVKAGPSSVVTERTVNCQAHVNFRGSATGWQFALKEHWSRGYLELDGAGVTLTQYLTVYFSQDAANTVSTYLMNDPYLHTNSIVFASSRSHSTLGHRSSIYSQQRELNCFKAVKPAHYRT
ncbi:hypothetical protein FHL15_000737 [Xylaria flabelliformis]|uniref:Uncharacterized protein n=1 Tax=Xylaria flabelliformis TaxID=2512241 RepID=A0A553ID10_9PEZI|nr:hypothetical protein FHL15_000737 [Xylaria flabelliformis]